MTEYDPDTAPGGHDERADDRAHRHFDAIAQQKQNVDAAHEFPSGIPVDDGLRHVLIVEEGGMSYIAPHLWEDRPDCEPLRRAFEAFRAEVGEFRAGEGAETMSPGRFYCSVDFDGNFAPGSRIPEGASS